MIAKMKKLTFLIYHKEYESFLQDLREVGVVHIVERKSGEIEGQLQGSSRNVIRIRHSCRICFVMPIR